MVRFLVWPVSVALKPRILGNELRRLSDRSLAPLLKCAIRVAQAQLLASPLLPHRLLASSASLSNQQYRLDAPAADAVARGRRRVDRRLHP